MRPAALFGIDGEGMRGRGLGDDTAVVRDVDIVGELRVRRVVIWELVLAELDMDSRKVVEDRRAGMMRVDERLVEVVGVLVEAEALRNEVVLVER